MDQSLSLRDNSLRSLLLNLESAAHDAGAETGIKEIEVRHQLKKRGATTKLVVTGSSNNDPNPDDRLIKAVAKAHLWHVELTNGTAASIDELAKQHNEDRNEVSRFLSLAHLAPDIVEKILNGTQPIDLTVDSLRPRLPIPCLWEEQRNALGFTA